MTAEIIVNFSFHCGFYYFLFPFANTGTVGVFFAISLLVWIHGKLLYNTALNTTDCIFFIYFWKLCMMEQGVEEFLNEVVVNCRYVLSLTMSCSSKQDMY